MLTYNTGAAFSFLAGAGGWQRWFLAGVALLVRVFIVGWLFRLSPSDRGLVIPLGLILGGGIGNLLDRLFLGHVIDFISLHYENWYWPAFNLADSAITVGAVWVLVGAVFGRPSQTATPPVS
jgi:signal peptidase II